MKKVHLAATPFAAHLAAQVLRNAGIPAMVEGESLQGGLGDLPMDLSTRPAVLVLDDEDADRAVALLAQRRRDFAEGGGGEGEE